MPLKRIVILIMLLITSTFGNADAKENDFGIWIDMAAIKKIHSATFGLLGEFYTRNNSNSIERTSIGLKGDYSFFPWLSAGAGYLFMNFKRPGYMELRNRYYFQVEPSWHSSRFYFSFRERLQVTLFPETRTNASATHYWRNRFEACYRNSEWKFEPLIDLESLSLLNGADLKYCDELRILLGSNYHITNNQKIKFYGMLTTGASQDRFIVGIAYEIKL